MNTTQIQQDAKAVLQERGKQWGDFRQFVDELYTLKNDFRLLILNVGDWKYYYLKCFGYEMMCLKLVRAIIVTRALGKFDVSDSRLKDCAIDFINYCTLLREIVPFRIGYKNLQTEEAWEWFFERVVRHIALGEEDDTES